MFIVLCVLFFVISYCGFLKKDDYPLHVHHWFIGYCFSLFHHYQDPISMICFCLGYGMFINGMATYGIDSIFHN